MYISKWNKRDLSFAHRERHCADIKPLGHVDYAWRMNASCMCKHTLTYFLALSEPQPTNTQTLVGNGNEQNRHLIKCDIGQGNIDFFTDKIHLYSDKQQSPDTHNKVQCVLHYFRDDAD